jgi:4-hydroxybenzoate polyprenyltransferase
VGLLPWVREQLRADRVWTEHDCRVDSRATSQQDRNPSGYFSSLGEAGYIILGIVGGAAALFISLVTLLVGLLPVAILGVYVGKRAGAHRWAFIGGLMIGPALCVLPILGPAVTNNDPSVRYSSSTIPVLIAALAVGVVGVVTVVAGAMTRRTRGSRRAHGPGPKH